MTQHQHWKSAALQHAKNAAQRRAQQTFTLSYRGGGTAQIVGYTALASYLQVKESSVPVLLSRGKGSFTLMRANPLTSEPDIVEVTRLLPAKEPKRPRGRPPKEIDWDRLGPEAPNHPAGTLLAHTAKTVPKTRNRRTDEKR